MNVNVWDLNKICHGKCSELNELLKCENTESGSPKAELNSGYNESTYELMKEGGGGGEKKGEDLRSWRRGRTRACGSRRRNVKNKPAHDISLSRSD